MSNPQALSLIELRDRLNAIIAENEQRGHGDRNRLPVYLRTTRKTRRSDDSTYTPVARASGAGLTFLNNDGDRVTCMTLEANEEDMTKPSRQRSLNIELKAIRKVREGIKPTFNEYPGMVSVTFGASPACAQRFVEYCRKYTAYANPNRPCKGSTVYFHGTRLGLIEEVVHLFMNL